MQGKVFAKGLNIMGQTGQLLRPITPQFTQISTLNSCKVKSIEGGFMNNHILLNDGQILQLGYILDNLTSARIMSYYKKFPKLFLFYQKYSRSFLGKTLSFNDYMQTPTLINKTLIQFHAIRGMAVGGAHILALDKLGRVFSMGQNTKGQLGNNSIKFSTQFTPVLLPTNLKAIDIACGFQTSYFVLQNGSVYACGKSSHYQIIPLGHSNIIKDLYLEPLVVTKYHNIKKVASGFSHTLFLSRDNRLYSCGNNTKGQCGINIITNKQISTIQQIFCYFTKDEQILDIKCGFHHSVVLTDKNAYLFGSCTHNQYPFPRVHSDDICSPLRIPLQDKPVKIFAKFDRTAIITDKSRCLIFGGQNLLPYGGSSGQLQINSTFPLNHQSSIGLGYMHTLIAV